MRPKNTVDFLPANQMRRNTRLYKLYHEDQEFQTHQTKTVGLWFWGLDEKTDENINFVYSRNDSLPFYIAFRSYFRKIDKMLRKMPNSTFNCIN